MSPMQALPPCLYIARRGAAQRIADEDLNPIPFTLSPPCKLWGRAPRVRLNKLLRRRCKVGSDKFRVRSMRCTVLGPV